MSIKLESVCVLLQVFDMQTSMQFYRGVLGFALVSRWPPEGQHVDWALLRLGGAELMLNTAFDSEERPSAPDAARTAAHADTTLYFACQDVDHVYRHLRSHELDVKPPQVAPYGMKQVYVSDPDGYQLCFQWPAA